MNNLDKYLSIMKNLPDAAAAVRGRGINLNVKFYAAQNGVLVVSEGTGLPNDSGRCGGAVLGFHIHGGSDCNPRGDDTFGGAMSHYDLKECHHPYHAGDMPPLFSNRGYAFSVFLTDRFTVDEIIGKTVILHSHPDDFTSQPAGMSGEKIACGVIRTTRSHQ